jgi:hypothetical protein
VEQRESFWRRNGWLKWVLGGLLLVLVAIAVTVSLVLHRAEPFLRAVIVQALTDHFHARVELDDFHISLVDGLRAQGKGLRIWPPAEVRGVIVPSAATSGPGEPLIRLDEFRFHAPLSLDPAKPIYIQVVQLRGLRISMPPKSHFEKASASQDSGTSESKPKGATALLKFRVGTIDCVGAELILGTSKPGKLPLDFKIAHLGLTDISAAEKMKFDAELVNAKPTGIIHSKGSFGPWQISDPGESPIDGDYRFEHANLADFKGIAGILSSTGHYQGTLRDIVADGDTDTPDFRLTHFNSPMPLHTHFHARIDGTNGDTRLEPVEATLGHSHFWVNGQAVRVVVAEPGQPLHSKGHDIDLDIKVDRANLDDFMRLVSNSGKPLLIGPVTVKAELHISPGPLPVHERMQLNGHFDLDQARFTSTKIQNGIEQLSLRAQGRPKDTDITDSSTIRSHMVGDFRMGGGVIKLPALTYTVPGAEIQLRGTYGLDGGSLDFWGKARMDATVSQIVGGWKGFLLKPADRFFKKNGAGTEIPIHIDGTRENPKFGFGTNR